MKELYINGKRVTIDSSTYFPFTHLISDLENVNIMNMPSSKSIIVKRCKENDDIFGQIGSLTRFNIGSVAGGVGALYNQITKCEYTLYDNSVIISKGILTIDGINDTEYSITLYDDLIQKLEDLKGDVENNEYLLSNCPILNGSTPYTFDARASIIGALTNGSPVCPVVCIKDSVLDDGSIRCYTATGGTTSITSSLVELPSECNSIQLRSIKNWELNYAYPVSKMIDSINYTYPNSISYDSTLIDTFNDINLLTNIPTNNYISDKYNIKYDTIESVTGTFILNNNNSPYNNLVTRNGHYSFDLFLTFDLKSASPSTTIASHYYNGVLIESFNTSTPDGTQIGKIWVKNNLQIGSSFFGQPTWREIALLYNVNTFVTLNGSGNAEYIDIVVNIGHEADFYPEILYSGTSTLDADIFLTNPADSKEVYTLLNGGTLIKRIMSSGSTVTYNSIDFKTGEEINGSKIFPKIGIKDFIIQLAKFFNLDIIILDNTLHLQPKQYYETNEILAITEITDMNINNITFDKIQLNNTLPSSTYLTEYKKKYKQDYGCQIINTGYSIKKNTKQITLEAGIPILLKDYNNYAYDKFTRYFNGGYSKVNHGVVNGYKDNLVFGYINEVDALTYFTDDTTAEAGMTSTATEIKFTHYNPCLISETTLPVTDANRFYFVDNLISGVAKKTSYFTFSPYKFAGLNILKSLEVNKPKINYAKITDANYPDTTTLYYKYHRNLLIDKYNHDTHILSCKIYINDLIDVYKIYNYNNSNYIISNIVEYDPTQSGIYEIELMKVNDPNNYINNIIL